MRKILLIGLKYQNYTDEIIDELRGQGHEVTYHDIQPRNLLMKTLRVLAPHIYTQRINRHHNSILAQESGKPYELVLFIQVHQMTLNTLVEFRNEFRSAEFVLYNWDAVTTHDYRPYLHLFDRVYTFDPKDAAATGVRYLPLFCIRAFQNLKKRDNGQKAIYFVGNIVSVKRYEAIQAFKLYCQRNDIKFKSFLACSPVVLWRLIIASHLPLDISLHSIRFPVFIDMIETSVAVFDFANHQQSGYTMRTMENLCAGKKIITNNLGIMNESFYSDDRIHVFNGLDFSSVKVFLDKPLRKPQETFPAYHLSSFVRQLAEAPSGHAESQVPAERMIGHK